MEMSGSSPFSRSGWRQAIRRLYLTLPPGDDRRVLRHLRCLADRQQFGTKRQRRK